MGLASGTFDGSPSLSGRGILACDQPNFGVRFILGTTPYVWQDVFGYGLLI